MSRDVYQVQGILKLILLSIKFEIGIMERLHKLKSDLRWQDVLWESGNRFRAIRGK